MSADRARLAGGRSKSKAPARDETSEPVRRSEGVAEIRRADDDVTTSGQCVGEAPRGGSSAADGSEGPCFDNVTVSADWVGAAPRGAHGPFATPVGGRRTPLRGRAAISAMSPGYVPRLFIDLGDVSRRYLGDISAHLGTEEDRCEPV